MNEINIVKKPFQDKLDLLIKKLRDNDYAHKIEVYQEKLNSIKNSIEDSKDILTIASTTNQIEKIEKEVLALINSTNDIVQTQIEEYDVIHTIEEHDIIHIVPDEEGLKKEIERHKAEEEKNKKTKLQQLKDLTDMAIKTLSDAGSLNIDNVQTYIEFSLLKTTPEVIYKIPEATIGKWDRAMVEPLIIDHALQFLSFNQINYIYESKIDNFKNDLYQYLILDKIYGNTEPKVINKGLPSEEKISVDMFPIAGFQSTFDNIEGYKFLIKLIKETKDEKTGLAFPILDQLDNLVYIYDVISSKKDNQNQFATVAKITFNITDNTILHGLNPLHLKFISLDTYKSFDDKVFKELFDHNSIILKSFDKRQLKALNSDFCKIYYSHINFPYINFEVLSHFSHQELVENVMYPLLGTKLDGNIEDLKNLYYTAITIIPAKDLMVLKNAYQVVSEIMYKKTSTSVSTASLLFDKIVKNQIQIQSIESPDMTVLINGHNTKEIDLLTLDVEKWKYFSQSNIYLMLENTDIKKNFIDHNLLDYFNDTQFSIGRAIMTNHIGIDHTAYTCIFAESTLYGEETIKKLGIKYSSFLEIFQYGNTNKPFSLLGYYNKPKIDPITKAILSIDVGDTRFDRFINQIIIDYSLGDEKNLLQAMNEKDTEPKQIIYYLVVRSLNMVQDISNIKYRDYYKYIYVERLRYLLRDEKFNEFKVIATALLRGSSEEKKIFTVKVSHISSTLLKDMADAPFLQFLLDNCKKPNGGNFSNLEYAQNLCNTEFLQYVDDEKKAKADIRATVIDYKNSGATAHIEAKCVKIDPTRIRLTNTLNTNDATIPITNNINFDYALHPSDINSHFIDYSDLVFCDKTCKNLGEEFFPLLNSIGLKELASVSTTLQILENTKEVNPLSHNINLIFYHNSSEEAKNLKLNKDLKVQSLDPRTNVITNVLNRSINEYLTIPTFIELQDVGTLVDSKYVLHAYRFCGAAKCIYYYKNTDPALKEYILIGLFSKNTAIAEKLEEAIEKFSFKYKKIKKFDALYEAFITERIIKNTALNNCILAAYVSEFTATEIGYDTGYICNMESAFLDLQEFVTKVSIMPNNITYKRTILKIAIVIIDMLIKMYNAGLMYIDLKLQNIMIFIDNTNKKFFIKFIDVGSIIPSNLDLGSFYNYIFIQNSKANYAWAFNNGKLPDFHNINVSPEDGDKFKDLLFRINILRRINTRDITLLTPNDKELFDAFRCSFLMNIMYFTINLLTYYINGENYEGNYNYVVGDSDVGLTTKVTGGSGAPPPLPPPPPPPPPPPVKPAVDKSKNPIAEIKIETPSKIKGDPSSQKPNIYEFEMSLDKFYTCDEDLKSPGSIDIQNDKTLRDFSKKYYKFMASHTQYNDVAKYYDDIEKNFNTFTTELKSIHDKCNVDEKIILNPPIIINKWMLKMYKLLSIKSPNIYRENLIDDIIGFNTATEFKVNLEYFKNNLDRIYKLKKNNPDVEDPFPEFYNDIKKNHFMKFKLYRDFLVNYNPTSILYRIKKNFGSSIEEAFHNANVLKINEGSKNLVEKPDIQSYILYKTATIYDYVFIQKISHEYLEIYHKTLDTKGTNTVIVIYEKRGVYFNYLEDLYGKPRGSITDINTLRNTIVVLPDAKTETPWKTYQYYVDNFSNCIKIYNGPIIGNNIIGDNLTVIGKRTQHIIFAVHINDLDNLMSDLRKEYKKLDFINKIKMLKEKGNNIIIAIHGPLVEKQAYFTSKGIDITNDAGIKESQLYLRTLTAIPVNMNTEIIRGGTKEKVNYLSSLDSSMISPLMAIGGGSIKFYQICLFVIIIVLLMMLLYVVFYDSSTKDCNLDLKDFNLNIFA